MAASSVHAPPLVSLVSAARLSQLYLAWGEGASLSQLKPHFWCESVAESGRNPEFEADPQLEIR
eukprot:7274410-Prymnesium_polylepis.1